MKSAHSKISGKNRSVLHRKEREKQMRQREILGSARELFLQKGYHNTTLEEIALHAEFGKGTIYNYFSSKEELFYGMLDAQIEEIHKAAESSINPPGDVRSKFTDYAKRIVSYAEVNSDILQLVVREMHSLNSPNSDARLRNLKRRYTNVMHMLAKLIADEIEEKRIRKLDSLKLATLFQSMVQFVCINRFGPHRLEKVDNMDDEVALIVSVFFDGISEPKPEG
jgi:AcrR family transcriptional regulator